MAFKRVKAEKLMLGMMPAHPEPGEKSTEMSPEKRKPREAVFSLVIEMESAAREATQRDKNQRRGKRLDLKARKFWATHPVF